MFNLLTAFGKNRIWPMKGGVRPPQMKSPSDQIPLRRLPLPDRLIVPLQAHLGPDSELCVQVGEQVLRGQPLTRSLGATVPVHAPTSGTVQAVRYHTATHPSGLPALSLILIPDGDDRWVERRPLQDFRQIAPQTLRGYLHQAGIDGLGSVGLATASPWKGQTCDIDTLIINAAESEPYLSADDRLMQECAEELAVGIDILDRLFAPQRILLGIEDNKPQAIAALKQALHASPRVQIRVIPTRYPSSDAAVLTRVLTGKTLHDGQPSTHVGVSVQNISTLYAVKRAVIDGEPLTERVVTVAGQALQQPGNVWARLGTPVRFLLRQAGYRVTRGQPTVIVGGPMTGFTLPELDVPILPTSSAILAPSQDEIQPETEEQSCIRCGECADACPTGLQPQQLFKLIRDDSHEQARQHRLTACIECGACAYVCPSHIPLVQYFRQSKAEIQSWEQEAQRAAAAKARFVAKKARLEREKQAREQRHQRAATRVAPAPKTHSAPSGDVKPATGTTSITSGKPGAAVMAAIERAKALQAEVKVTQPPAATPHQPAPTADAMPTRPSENDPRKAAVAAAIARIKARKAAQQQASSPDAPSVSPVEMNTPAAVDTGAENDPRKAAVAAAIARVKARKAAQQQASSPDAPSVSPEENNTPAAVDTGAENDPHKAAVAAAIARVKARKAAQQQAASPDTSPVSPEENNPQASVNTGAENDPRKAAVAAAIARVKARKAAQALQRSQTEPKSQEE
ncbi:electron transport complex subunit RsxC [Lonsdalea quercina]|uniref:electron transport complex subunit RsxC n=1 Tax=Lonsdalea quercina TaxID=71657 RepID=UPI003F481378